MAGEVRSWSGRTALVTGAASGIGRAIAAAFEARGARVLRVDLTEGDIAADLSTPAGRALLIERAAALAPDGLDAVVAAAGVAAAPPETVISVNYFGAVATLEGTRPLLARRPGSCAIAIVSSATIMGRDDAIVAACLANDEEGARESGRAAGEGVYADSKLAFGRWLRTAATSADWAGAGIALNGISPGTIRTPMTADLLATEAGRARLAEAAPIAVADYAEPEAIAEVALALAALESGYVVGQILFVDGGADAILRPRQV